MKAKDLAKKLGVSPATISLVLNNKPGISDSLRKSLLEKIQELGHEEMLCQSCREGAEPVAARPAPQQPPRESCACRVIAYLIYQDRVYWEDMNDPYKFFSGVMEGVESEAWENDCCVVMVHMNRHKNVSLAEQLRRMGNVIGVIVHPCMFTEQVKGDMQAVGLPYVFMDAFTLPDWEPSSVCISNRMGMYRAVEYLHKKGHRKIGYVFSGWESFVETDRRSWFLQAMKSYQVPVREEFFFCAGTGSELFEYDRLAKLFEEAKELPTALVCENDRQAWRTIKALAQIGRKVPGDVSVIGFDDQPICTMSEPYITTIRNSPQLMGRECVIMLNNLIRLRQLGEREPWLRYELPATLVERNSVGELEPEGEEENGGE